ncbi:lish motif-containing protein [Mycena pura]|uniref:Lish motif-containing protein n=1 Tax=Mycena pura TaxID=153505 RepID=A0AAD6VPU7_9AGAR|nr:lish motif-containing protein [Mycena pura]
MSIVNEPRGGRYPQRDMRECEELAKIPNNVGLISTNGISFCRCIKRALVLDYLTHHGYSATARVFAQGSTVTATHDADGDEVMRPVDAAETTPRLSDESFRQVDLRQRIRTHILSGQINDAIELLELHFPAVLSSETSPSTSKPHKSLTGTEFVASTTLNPAHLNLNLRILAFTEAFRAAPLNRVLPTTADSPSLDKDDDQSTLELLAKAKKLSVLVHMLPSPDRATYSKELENVAGLLAYPDPQSSPVAKYLSKERREAVANQINTAILYRIGLPAVSHLELVTRYTVTLWSFLQDFHATSPSLKGVKATDGSELPGFDLQQFLNSRS